MNIPGSSHSPIKYHLHSVDAMNCETDYKRNIDIVSDVESPVILGEDHKKPTQQQMSSQKRLLDLLGEDDDYEDEIDKSQSQSHSQSQSQSTIILFYYY
eukprot:Pgem_evm2s15895